MIHLSKPCEWGISMCFISFGPRPNKSYINWIQVQELQTPTKLCKGRAALCRSGAGGRTLGDRIVTICSLFTNASIIKCSAKFFTAQIFGLFC
jgi:hypothetical protein